MRLLADECVYAKTIKFLKKEGHEVRRVQEEGLSGSKDPEVLQHTIKNDLVLLTRDRDFQDIIKYPPSQHKGIIVMEIHPKHMDAVHRALAKMLETHENLSRTLAIADRQKYRLVRV